VSLTLCKKQARSAFDFCFLQLNPSTEVTGCVLDGRDSFPAWALQFFSAIRPAAHSLATAGFFRGR
jgi:hypothetical protein